MNKRKITRLMGVLILCNISLFIFTASYYGFNGTYVISEKFEKINPKDNVKLSTTHALEWNETWDGSSGGDSGYGIALDGSGNAFITGSTNSGGIAAGLDNFCLLKYDSSGNLLWDRTWGGSANELGRGIAVDGSGNVFISGETYIRGVGSYAFLFLKYDSSGNMLWNKTGRGRGYGIAVDGSGNVFITGSYLLKYDSSGNLLWNKTGGGRGYGIAVDGSGNAFIAGSTVSDGTRPSDVFLLKYDSSGNQLWNKTWGGSDWDDGHGIALDASGNVFITGKTYSFGAGYSDVFLLKYDSSGNMLWEKTWGGYNYECGYGIAVDGSGNAFITGSYNINYGTETSDAFLLKYDSSGNILWETTWGGEGRGIALDGSGNAFIAGSTVIGGARSSEVFLLKYGVDTDEDGLSDDVEVNTYFTDPNDSDTDGDDLSDGDEVNIHGTDPTNNDTE